MLAYADSLVEPGGRLIQFDISIPTASTAERLALLVSLTLFFGISLASRPPRLDPDVEALMGL